MRSRHFILLAALVFAAGFLCAQPSRVFASSSLLDDPVEEPRTPPTLEELENLPRINKVIDDKAGLPFDIRENAIREAALSYGARGGLAWRTYHIRSEMERRAGSMDKVYDFRQLLIAAPSGLLIEPPVISESINALIITGKGTEAAVSDRIYDIIANARIVGAPRSWRNYLERDWGEVTEPPDLLRPVNESEREQWIKWVRKGWEEGARQADDIFRDDLNELMADYQGMVRYRMLLAQGIVTPPYALQIDRGVTGGGDVLRVGDRAVQITGMPALIPGAERWQPANR